VDFLFLLFLVVVLPLMLTLRAAAIPGPRRQSRVPGLAPTKLEAKCFVDATPLVLSSFFFDFFTVMLHLLRMWSAKPCVGSPLLGVTRVRL
jgi:hypothetical protein